MTCGSKNIKKKKRINYLLLFWWLITRPSWAWAKIRGASKYPGNSRKSNIDRLAEYEKYHVSIETAIQEVCHAATIQSKEIFAEFSALKIDKSIKTSFIPSEWDASDELALLCYAIIRITKPLAVVETGVARGVTSFYILKALEENKQGHLYSFDLPVVERNAEKEVGLLVSNSLKTRWTLSLGSSLKEMKKIRKKVPNIDIFIHDSDHTYAGERKEYNYALNWFNNSGILISDDVCTNALLDFFEVNGGKLMTLKQAKDCHLGLLKFTNQQRQESLVS
jgi:predicted O-methyltransferase YrrM